MSKIKVGDNIRSRVTCVFREKNFITWNKIYEVANITDCETGYQVVNDVNELMIFKMCNFDKEFELVEQKTDFVVDKVIQKFRERSQIGIEKYGKTLAENNTDNFLNHLQEELMDAVNYIQKLQSLQKGSNTKTNVIEWAEKRNLIHATNVYKQYWKLQEECNELYKAILDNNKDEIIDALGDIRVVITILAKQLDLDIDDCFDSAYNVIKNRTGVTINGEFKKD